MDEPRFKRDALEELDEIIVATVMVVTVEIIFSILNDLVCRIMSLFPFIVIIVEVSVK